jgi:hypothetical protein
MERINVTLDDTAKSAGAYLAADLGNVGLSAAIRYALFQTAKRKGWKPESVMERRRPDAARTPPDDGRRGRLDEPDRRRAVAPEG